MYPFLILQISERGEVAIWRALTRWGNSDGLQEHPNSLRLRDIYHFIDPLCEGLFRGPEFSSVIIIPVGGLALSCILCNRHTECISGEFGCAFSKKLNKLLRRKWANKSDDDVVFSWSVGGLRICNSAQVFLWHYGRSEEKWSISQNT